MKFDQLYQQLMESMSRRNFLGLMGKGAAIAGIAPKGVIGKIAMGVPVNKSPISASKAIIDFYECSGNIGELKNAFTNMIGALTQSGAKFLRSKPMQNSIANFYENIATGDMEVVQEDLMDITYGILDNLYKEGFLTPQVIARLEGSDPFLGEYIEELQNPKTWEQRVTNTDNDTDNDISQYAKSINYSRADKAGGSEDEGYAKYYEKSNHKKALL